MGGMTQTLQLLLVLSSPHHEIPNLQKHVTTCLPHSLKDESFRIHYNEIGYKQQLHLLQ